MELQTYYHRKFISLALKNTPNTGERDEIFRPRPRRPWGPTSLLYHEHRVSRPEVQRPGHVFKHPPHLTPRLKRESKATLLIMK